jgi:hypothetical protein
MTHRKASIISTDSYYLHLHSNNGNRILGLGRLLLTVRYITLSCVWR